MEQDEHIGWVKTSPFLLIHLLAVAAIIWIAMGLASWMDPLVCLLLWRGRTFFITAGYHRYFSHRSYRMGRFMQLVMAVGGCTCAQKGPLWWAAHHRDHHRHSDTPLDPHDSNRGFLWSHMLWIMVTKNDRTKWENVRDLTKFPELRWLNRYHLVPPTLLALACYQVGGWSMLLVGFFLSTVILWHSTFTINSLSHYWGTRRYETSESSRNNFLLALLTMGEGWHNNHHYHQGSTRQGFFWWEVDMAYYILRTLSFLRLIGKLNEVPSQKLAGPSK